MPIPSVALAACSRVKKNAQTQRASLLRLTSDVRNAASAAKKADAKSAISFWGQVKELSDRAKDQRKIIEPTFDDAEVLVKYKRELPEASTLLVQIRQLAEAVEDLASALDDLVANAKRISDKSGQLAKIKAQSKDPKLETQFTKAFDAGMTAIGILTIALAVYKQIARKKSNLR